MNIIFKQNLPAVDHKYTTLDLDTFCMPDGSQYTACCVVENIPIDELSQTENLKQLHGELIANYGQQRWDFCEQAIEQLMGRWGGEVDSFYVDLKNRIDQLKGMTLDSTWTPVILKTST
jgi:hypothetical protein